MGTTLTHFIVAIHSRSLIEFEIQIFKIQNCIMYGLDLLPGTSFGYHRAKVSALEFVVNTFICRNLNLEL